MLAVSSNIRFGKFSFPQGDILGELGLAGSNTYLSLRDEIAFDAHSIEDGFVNGILHDRTKVTLVQCVVLQTGSAHGFGSDRDHTATIFPHFILEGRQHIAPNADVVQGISFVLGDITSLFYDFDAFGSLIHAAPFIDAITTANKLNRCIEIGPDPQIAYFTGKRIMSEVRTKLGTVIAQHNPSWPMGGPRGVRIDNTISVRIVPDEPISFTESISRMHILLRFLEEAIGRPQIFESITVQVVGPEHPELLRVHYSYAPADSSGREKRSPGPGDLPLSPIERPSEFEKVLCNWIELDEERKDARVRFSQTSRSEDTYSADRLVSVANVFDILPKTSVPYTSNLSPELLQAKEQCRNIFKDLPDTIERNSVLGALGRIGIPSLKHKVRSRTNYILDAIPKYFPNLQRVTDEAVNCRNHYVHGTSSKVDYADNFDLVAFLTDTLEFVFSASEFVECGWDVQAFVRQPTSMTHPFGTYLVNYKLRIKHFEELFPQ